MKTFCSFPERAGVPIHRPHYGEEVDKKRSLESAEVDSANFLRMRSLRIVFVGGGGGENRFYSSFLCKVQTHCCFQIFLKGFVELVQICALQTQRHWAFLRSNVCFCISYVLQCMQSAKSNTIWTFKIKRIVWPTCPHGYVLLVIHVVLQSVSGEQVCRLQLNNMPVCSLTSYPNPGSVVWSWLVCYWWLLLTFCNVASA